jgi:hypothetical protein
MKRKPCIKYHLHDKRLAIVIFYVVFYSVILLPFLVSLFSNSEKELVYFNNVELASLIFIFILGLNSFKSPFLFLKANGISRKTVYTSFFASLVPIALLFAITNTLNSIVFPHFASFRSAYGSLYCGDISTIGNIFTSEITMTPMDIMLSFIWLFLLHFMFATFGYFITLLYYRMNTLLKYVVSFGVPLLLVIVLPIACNLLESRFQLHIGENLFAFLFKLLGITESAIIPGISFITFAVIIGIFALFSYLLIKKAPIKQS